MAGWETEQGGEEDGGRVHSGILLLLVSMGLMLASCVEKSWNMAMIAYVLCALAAAIISALWFAALTTPAA